MYCQLAFQKTKRIILEIDDPLNCRHELERLEKSGMASRLGEIEREMQAKSYNKPTTLDDFF